MTDWVGESDSSIRIHRRERRFKKALACLVVAAGCGSVPEADSGNSCTGGSAAGADDGGAGGFGGNDAPLPLALADFPSAFSKALCTFSVDCETSPDQSACEASRDPAPYATLVAAVMRGTIAYDADAAGACVRAWASSRCDQHGNPEACDRMFRGQVPVGGVCVDNEECMDEGSCAIGTTTCRGSCCVGSCIARPAPMCVVPIPLGGICNAFSTCASPGTCFQRSDGPQGGTCAVPAEEGENCAATNCRDFYGTYCDPETSVCAKRKQPGQSCRDHSSGPPITPGAMECVEYARCLGDVCVADRPLGASCVEDRDCLSRNCEAGACSARPPATPCLPAG